MCTPVVDQQFGYVRFTARPCGEFAPENSKLSRNLQESVLRFLYTVCSNYDIESRSHCSQFETPGKMD